MCSLSRCSTACFHASEAQVRNEAYNLRRSNAKERIVSDTPRSGHSSSTRRVESSKRDFDVPETISVLRSEHVSNWQPCSDGPKFFRLSRTSRTSSAHLRQPGAALTASEEGSCLENYCN